MKIEFGKYADMCATKEIAGADGVIVTVRNHIPYQSKIELATALVENCVMVHDDSCCYEWIDIHAERIKAILKYYTNIDVDDTPSYEVADFAINNELLNDIMDYIRDDLCEVENLFATIENGVIDSFDDDRSLRKAIRTSFGFLFNGEDITESLAKAELTKDAMYNAIKALNDKEKQEQTKLSDGKLKVGNNIVSFSKKK